MYILLLVKESWGGAEGNVRDILEPLARGSSTLGCCHLQSTRDSAQVSLTSEESRQLSPQLRRQLSQDSHVGPAAVSRPSR